MKRRFIISILMVLFLGTIAFSQDFSGNWRFNKVLYYSAVHGVSVTPDGSIWVCLWGANASMELVRGNILVLNPDGTEKARFTEFPDVDPRPTLFARGAGRGMSVSLDGKKVYHCAYDAIYVMDAEEMKLIQIIEPKEGNSITSVATDEFGNMLVGFVATYNNGVMAFTEDGLPLGLVIDALDAHLPTNSRDLALTPDGKDLYVANTTLNPDGQPTGVAHYRSEEGTWGVYTFVKAITDYSKEAEDIHLDPQGRLWIGINGNNGVNAGNISRFECWDLNTMTVVDAIVSPVFVETFNDAVPQDQFYQGGFVTPRGLAFSNDGKKAYVVDFNTGLLEYDYVGTIDAKEPQAVPEGFALSQNYPNPFNPSTNFTYSLPNKADVRIAIYDLFGREIKTLVNESKDAGTYNITWNGRDNQNRQVSTGVYFYKMQTAGFEKTMKMMLMK